VLSSVPSAQVARENRQNVLPHPTVIQSFLRNLVQLLEADEERARALLRRFMPAVVLMPLPGGGFKITGGFDQEATVGTETPPASPDLLLRLSTVGGTGYRPRRGGSQAGAARRARA
jgi:hypothetical protein